MYSLPELRADLSAVLDGDRGAPRTRVVLNLAMVLISAEVNATILGGIRDTPAGRAAVRAAAQRARAELVRDNAIFDELPDVEVVVLDRKPVCRWVTQ